MLQVVDMHCDTISTIAHMRKKGENCNLRENTLHLDLNRMRESGYLLQNFALFVDRASLREAAPEPLSEPRSEFSSELRPELRSEFPVEFQSELLWNEVCRLYGLYREELSRNTDLIAPAESFEAIQQNRAAGKMSAFLTVEEGGVCGGSLDRLEELYRMGVRMLTLTWNYANELGCSASEAERRFTLTGNQDGTGLTERGREFVVRMNELGMIVDVSHLSDEGFRDVCRISKVPFVASHSNARAICGHRRNLTDEMIRELADKGGCMGVNFYWHFLGGMEDLVRHAKHIVKIGGEQVLGLGTDFDGIDTNPELEGVQCMGRVWDALHKEGFHESLLDKIFYENVLRVYRECLL